MEWLYYVLLSFFGLIGLYVIIRIVVFAGVISVHDAKKYIAKKKGDNDGKEF